jgi:steroid 5-alpha reductase family enzyme
VGCVLLVLLFQGSTRFTEMLTAAKYPAYKAYQRTVPMLVPWPPATASWKDE